MKTITIDPMTRLEGHGRISIFLDSEGNVDRALFQVPELRGFEAFVVGRPAVDMPQITSRICGVCPMAHHMAATKALDALYGVEPPPTARAIREFAYHAFMVEDHALHFYCLGGPDFLVGPTAPAAERNVVGLVSVLGRAAVEQVVTMRARLRQAIDQVAGKVVHPVFGLPGGVSQPVDPALRGSLVELARDSVDFALASLKLFHDKIWSNDEHRRRLSNDTYFDETNYMGQVDGQGRVNLYDGDLRVVTPGGQERLRFAPADYAQHLAEHVEEWTYIKFPYLREPGWRGFVDGEESGVYRVAPLARLNAATGMATPRAQEEYERMYELLRGKPVHHTLAYHWARLIELLQAAERLVELSHGEELYGRQVRNMDLQTPRQGVGCIEAPRGTLIHHYETDERGIIESSNLIVATVNNAAAMCLSIERAARQLIHRGQVDEGILNQVEMAFRAYDPCMACASHALTSEGGLALELIDAQGRLLRSW
jgi:F420-non-reducing hydrogenase large subunit